MNLTFTNTIETTEEQDIKVLKHVLEFYCDNETIEEIKEAIENIKHDYNYNMVSGGCLLISYTDINDFLTNELDIQILDDVQGFSIYKELVNEVVYKYIIEEDDKLLYVGFSTGTAWINIQIIPCEYYQDEVEAIEQYTELFPLEIPRYNSNDENIKEYPEDYMSVNGGQYYINIPLIIEEI